MKEDVKMKENMNVEPMGTMPQVGAMQHMKAAPNVLPMQTAPMQTAPMQTAPNVLPMQQNPMGVMPSMMNQMPMMCCPYLMNMQCPMTYGQNVMGMNMMNPMYSGVSPISGNMNPVMGAASNGMNAMPGMGMMPSMMPGMGMMPAMNQYYPMGGM